jgi:hypothetical protein
MGKYINLDLKRNGIKTTIWCDADELLTTLFFLFLSRKNGGERYKLSLNRSHEEFNCEIKDFNNIHQGECHLPNLCWNNLTQMKEKHAHKVISRFEYFRIIFESWLVLVKQRSVLSAESNFDSDGRLRLLIKKSYRAPKKQILLFYAKK